MYNRFWRKDLFFCQTFFEPYPPPVYVTDPIAVVQCYRHFFFFTIFWRKKTKRDFYFLWFSSGSAISLIYHGYVRRGTIRFILNWTYHYIKSGSSDLKIRYYNTHSKRFEQFFSCEFECINTLLSRYFLFYGLTYRPVDPNSRTRNIRKTALTYGWTFLFANYCIFVPVCYVFYV